MPPTNFFGSSSEDESDEDIELGESVLDQAIKAYEDLMLEWHYRSRSEALIAFSNYAFYDRKLIATPNPGSIVSGRPIEFYNITEAFFNSKEGNIEEARLIAEEVRLLLKKDKKCSVGVISMGMAQQKAIEEQLELLLEKDSDFSTAYNFSLNYEENVQGDERDIIIIIIIISVGYARAKEGAKLRKSFGPLSSPGGGRKLNVAATRAKSKMKVYCSFDPSELSIDDDSFNRNKDTATFARFLHYCKNISDLNEKEAQLILDSFRSGKNLGSNVDVSFNLDIKQELEKKGYTVIANAGSCGFYLDLADIDPKDQNSYLLGIECDGSNFNVTDYSRDRDKARPVLLSTRGWEIYRVWSQDWSRNRQSELSKIVKRIEDAEL